MVIHRDMFPLESNWIQNHIVSFEFLFDSMLNVPYCSTQTEEVHDNETVVVITAKKKWEWRLVVVGKDELD